MTFLNRIAVLSVLSTFLLPSPGQCYTTLSVVDGRYYWELVFNYDNSENSGEIVHTFEVKKYKKVNAEEFLRAKSDVKTSYALNSKSSTEIGFKGVKAGASAGYQYHVDLARELEQKSNASHAIEETSTESRSYKIAGGGKLALYQLVYESNGMLQRTGIVSTKPVGEVFVQLEFLVTRRVLGLSDMEHVLLSTTPRDDNKHEWTIIRDAVVKNSHKDDYARFHDLVNVLSHIVPGVHNKGEWSTIRTTCHEILRDWNSYDKQQLFLKLLYRLAATKPGLTNVLEWNHINNAASQLVAGIKQQW